MTESCLVRGRWLVTAADEPVLRDAALLLEAGRVTAVEKLRNVSPGKLEAGENRDRFN